MKTNKLRLASFAFLKNLKKAAFLSLCTIAVSSLASEPTDRIGELIARQSEICFPYRDCVVGSIRTYSVDASMCRVHLDIDEVLKGAEDFCGAQDLDLVIEKSEFYGSELDKYVGLKVLLAFNKENNLIFNVSVFRNTVLKRKMLDDLRRKIAKDLSDDNCVVVQILDHFNNDNREMNAKVLESFNCSLITGDVCRLTLTNDLENKVKAWTKADNAKAAIGLTLASSMGTECVERAPSSWKPEISNLRIIITPSDATPDSIRRFAATTVSQRVRVMNSAHAYIKSTWNKARVTDYCRPEARGIHHQENRKPLPEDQYLCMSSEERDLSAELGFQDRKVYWIAIVHKGTITRYKLKVKCASSYWETPWDSPSLIGHDSSYFTRARIHTTLVESLSHFIYLNENTNKSAVNQLNAEWPEEATEQLKHDASGAVSAFTWVGRDGRKMCAVLDHKGGIHQIFCDGKLDTLWSIVLAESASNYAKYVQETGEET